VEDLHWQRFELPRQQLRLPNSVVQ